jgi:hypothetical protein
MVEVVASLIAMAAAGCRAAAAFLVRWGRRRPSFVVDGGVLEDVENGLEGLQLAAAVVEAEIWADLGPCGCGGASPDHRCEFCIALERLEEVRRAAREMRGRAALRALR